LDTGASVCIFDNCSRLSISDCLQHDFEGIRSSFLVDKCPNVYTIGCRRVPSTSGSSDLCRFAVDAIDRPANKSEAVADAVVGGTVVSSTGAAAATQIGFKKFNLLCFYY
jgi:hypothetical protein